MKYKYIGTIVGKQRLNGEITVVDIPDWLPEIPNGTRIKIGYTEQFADDYTILYWKNKKNKAYINVNEIHSAWEVENLNEKGIFISHQLIKKISNKVYFIEELPGYKIINNTDDSCIGIIEDCFKIHNNEIWSISTEFGNVAIPVTSDIIIKIDNRKKYVFINLNSDIIQLLTNN